MTDESPVLALPHHPDPISGTVRPPGSKSITNRALLLAALADGRSRLQGISPSEDSSQMISALRSLGVEITAATDLVTVQGLSKVLGATPCTLDIGDAGTAMRFLLPLCACTVGAPITLQGSPRMHERPIGPLVEALRSIGAEIEYLGAPGCPPLRLHRRTAPTGAVVRISGTVSSQFISGLLMCAPLLPNGLAVTVADRSISRPYIDLTVATMKEFGINVAETESGSFVVSAGRYRAQEYQVEADASAASYLWGLAAISGGSVRVENLSFNSAQGDVKFAQVLAELGCNLSAGDSAVPWIEVQGTGSLRSIDIDLETMPDTAQTLAVIAACAAGKTTIRGLASLRVKETDRLSALTEELARVGIRSGISGDALWIEGGAPRSARIRTYGDHRMALSFALLATRTELEIEAPAVVRKSYPDFWNDLKRLGVESR